MKKILVTGALGQIGTELVERLRNDLGNDNVIASNINRHELDIVNTGPFEILDVIDGKKMYEIAKKYEVDTMINLAALLSATGEKNPGLLWDVNMNGLYNALEVSRELGLKIFTPSSIAAFGPETPRVNTPQDTVQRPTTIYGVSKVAGELLSDYYFKKFGVDARGVRFPGIISHKTLPGGGTTDYAVHIYYDAIKKGSYTSYIGKDTFLDMMYMPDAIDSIIDLMNADASKLDHRNAFNITAMSVDPEAIKNSIKKFIPHFTMDYDVDPVRQAIADSWPDSLDCSAAVREWGFRPNFDLDKMTEDMLRNIRLKTEEVK